MKHMKNYTSMLGQAGVYRVISELILRGHAPLIPAIDDGVDLMLMNGLRLQVKTTFEKSKHYRHRDRYSFQLSRSIVLSGAKVKAVKARAFSGQCDFLILHAVDEGRFWIIPAAILDGRYNVTIGDNPRRRYVDNEKVAALRQDGYSAEAIAKLLGSSRRTINRKILDPQFGMRGKDLELPKYENRWDLIESYGKTLSEASEAAATPVIVEG